MKLGPLIRAARQRSGLTLSELARRARVSPSYICRLEAADPTRKPSDDLLMRLSSVLSLDIDKVFVAAGRVPRDVVRFMARDPKTLALVRRRMERAA